MEAAAAMATLPASPCTSSSSPPPSLFLAPNPCCWKAAPRASLRASAAARRTLSSGWELPGQSAARPAARKPRLEELDTTNMLLRQRIVFLGSPVDDMSADLIISQLLLLDAEDQTKDIKLFINSPGGSITAGYGRRKVYERRCPWVWSRQRLSRFRHYLSLSSPQMEKWNRKKR
uniref:ATP-dependent Clp protease proteolytic subunit n=1 Tax=Leersia perrieri TaxID=77586 RepID=A0A0D9V1E9_9ORYZ